MLTYKRNFCGTVLMLLTGTLIVVSGTGWALSEDEYVQMAVEDLKATHEAQGDAQKMAKASENFLKVYSQEKIAAYIAMAKEIMQNSDKAERISQKIISLLRQMGYAVHMAKDSDISSVVFDR